MYRDKKQRQQRRRQELLDYVHQDKGLGTNGMDCTGRNVNEMGWDEEIREFLKGIVGNRKDFIGISYYDEEQVEEEKIFISCSFNGDTQDILRDSSGTTSFHHRPLLSTINVYELANQKHLCLQYNFLICITKIDIESA